MRFWQGKLIGFVLGMLLGIALVLVPVLLYRLSGRDYSLAADVDDFGSRVGFMYGLLGYTVFFVVAGLLFGIIGQAWGGRLQEAANQRSARRVASMQAEQAGNVWPPPPNTGDTDDT